MDKDALWYGPAKGQFIHGRGRMIEIWNSDEHDLRFSVGNMDFVTRERNCGGCSNNCEVICVYRNGRLIDFWGNRCDRGAPRTDEVPRP